MLFVCRSQVMSTRHKLTSAAGVFQLHSHVWCFFCQPLPQHFCPPCSCRIWFLIQTSLVRRERKQDGSSLNPKLHTSSLKPHKKISLKVFACVPLYSACESLCHGKKKRGMGRASLACWFLSVCYKQNQNIPEKDRFKQLDPALSVNVI